MPVISTCLYECRAIIRVFLRYVIIIILLLLLIIEPTIKLQTLSYLQTSMSDNQHLEKWAHFTSAEELLLQTGFISVDYKPSCYGQSVKMSYNSKAALL